MAFRGEFRQASFRSNDWLGYTEPCWFHRPNGAFPAIRGSNSLYYYRFTTIRFSC